MKKERHGRTDCILFCQCSAKKRFLMACLPCPEYCASAVHPLFPPLPFSPFALRTLQADLKMPWDLPSHLSPWEDARNPTGTLIFIIVFSLSEKNLNWYIEKLCKPQKLISCRQLIFDRFSSEPVIYCRAADIESAGKFSLIPDFMLIHKVIKISTKRLSQLHMVFRIHCDNYTDDMSSVQLLKSDIYRLNIPQKDDIPSFICYFRMLY